jgi:hypothetical protein
MVLGCILIGIFYVLYTLFTPDLLSESYDVKKQFQESMDNLSKEEPPSVEFPFKNIYDEQGRKLNIICISAPFRETNHELLYESYKNAGWNIIGISSYLEFPYKIDNPYEDRFHEERNHDYVSMVSAWIHCFRDPGYKLQYSRLPLLLMSEADLKNVDHYKPDPSIQKQYDFMYICLDDNERCTPGWNWYIRSWDLAKLCLEVMCSKYHLKGVIVGRTNCEFTEKCTGIVKTVPFLPFHEFQTEMQKCRFLFAPNVSDASPRVITEAILYDMPVLVNQNIVGGWTNVIPGVTGEFFTNEHDISQALDRILSPEAKYSPREWFVNHRGLEHSGKELAQFLKTNFPNINHPDMQYAYI